MRHIATDGCCYQCSNCGRLASIREGSFFNEFPGLTMMESIRVIFYYFIRGYSVEDVLRES